MKPARIRFATAIFPIAAALLPAGMSAHATPRDGAGASPAPIAEQSRFLGSWELDLGRMPATYGTPPKRVLYRFSDVGEGFTRLEVDITAPDGSVRHMAVRFRPDGKMVPGQGDTSEADSAALEAPASNVLVMSLAKNKTLGSVRVYAISADGREMTESAANVDGDGAPFVRNFHFKRLP